MVLTLINNNVTTNRLSNTLINLHPKIKGRRLTRTNFFARRPDRFNAENNMVRIENILGDPRLNNSDNLPHLINVTRNDSTSTKTWIGMFLTINNNNRDPLTKRGLRKGTIMNIHRMLFICYNSAR